MKGFILVVGLLNVASGYHSVGGIGGGGGIGGWGGHVVSRDAPADDLLDKSYVPNAIKQFVGNAMSGVTTEDLVKHCNKIKSGAQAQLDASGEKISDEQTDELLKEMAAKYPSISPADLLNSNALADEDYRMSTASKMLIDCAEDIKTRQRKGESYSAQLKVVIRLCDLIIAVSARVDIYTLSLYQRDVNKRHLLSRREPWNAGFSGSYDPNSGWEASGNFGYKKGNIEAGGRVGWNQHSGWSGGIGATWKFR